MIKATKYFTNDILIRSAFRIQIRRKYNNNNTMVVEELGLEHGSVRVDLATIGKTLHGYEFKSDMDTLGRLPRQMERYNEIMDKVTLVVGKNHILNAIKIIPDWWGITLVKIDPNNQKTVFQPIRKAVINKNKDNLAIAKLLWRNEALSLLEEIGLAKGLRSKPNIQLYKKLAVSLTQKDLLNKVKKILITRDNWRSDKQQRLGGDLLQLLPSF